MESLLEFNKSSTVFDKYEFKLEEKYRKFAESYLKETDSVREASLNKLRLLIKSDPRIIECRTDAPFLLRFLRVKKFCVKSAHKMIVRYIKNREQHPQWFKNVDVLDPLIVEMLDIGALIILPEHDTRGRQIWIYEFGRMVPGKHTSNDFIRLSEILYQMSQEDERSQISGAVPIINFANMTMKHAMIFPLWDFKKYISCVTKSVPQRTVAVYTLNLPRFMQIFFDVGSFLSGPKLRKRLRACKSLKELETFVDIDLFPEQYGGKLKQSDIISGIKEKMLSMRDKIKALDEMRVDLNLINSKDFEIIEDCVKATNNASSNNNNIDDLSPRVTNFRSLQVD